MPEVDGFLKRIWDEQKKNEVRRIAWEKYLDDLITKAMESDQALSPEVVNG